MILTNTALWSFNRIDEHKNNRSIKGVRGGGENNES